MSHRTSETVYSLLCRGGCGETIYIVDEKKSNEERIRDEYCMSCLPDFIAKKMRNFVSHREENTYRGDL